MDLWIKLSRAGRVLLLAALFLQAVLVQTHVHPLRLGAPEFSAAGMSGRPSAKLAPQLARSDDCPLCWEAAMAGHFYVPRAIALPPATAFAVWVAVSVAAAFKLARPARGWLSRAPPQ
jgi:hypothetical protein